MLTRTELRAAHPALYMLLWILGLALVALVAIGVGSILLDAATAVGDRLADVGGIS